MLGEKISYLRKKRKLTQDELGKIMCVSRQAIQKWEANINIPDVFMLKKLANYFNVTIDYFLSDEEDENSSKVKAEDENTSDTNITKEDNIDYIKYISDSLCFAASMDFVKIKASNIDGKQIGCYSFDNDTVFINIAYLFEKGITDKLIYAISKFIFIRKLLFEKKGDSLFKFDSQPKEKEFFENYSICYANIVTSSLFGREFEKIKILESKEVILEYSKTVKLIDFINEIKENITFEIKNDESNDYYYPIYETNDIREKLNLVSNKSNVQNEQKLESSYQYIQNLHNSTKETNKVVAIVSFILFIVILLIMNVVFLYGFLDGITTTIGQCLIPAIPVSLLAKKVFAKKGTIIFTICIYASFHGAFVQDYLDAGYGNIDATLNSFWFSIIIMLPYIVGMVNLYLYHYGGARHEK